MTGSRVKESGRGSDTEVSRHNDFNFIKFQLGQRDGRAYAQCSYPAFTYEIDILCKIFTQCVGEGEREQHRCVLDNFDSGPQ